MYRFLQFLALFLAAIDAKATEKLAKLITYLLFDLFRIRRTLILANLQRAFGAQLSLEQRKKIAHSATYHFVLTLLEFMRSKKHPLSADVSITGKEYIDAARAQNKGVVVLCTHCGNWEAMASAVSKLVAPTHVVVKEIAAKGTNRFVTEIRQQNGIHVLQRLPGQNVLLKIFRALKRNELVGFVIDQSRPGEPYINFFNHPAKTNTTLANIWWHTKVPIVPGFIVRESIGKHRVIFWPELELTKQNSKEETILELTKEFNRVAEQIVLSNPEQYFWHHNRWK